MCRQPASNLQTGRALGKWIEPHGSQVRPCRVFCNSLYYTREATHAIFALGKAGRARGCEHGERTDVMTPRSRKYLQRANTARAASPAAIGAMMQRTHRSNSSLRPMEAG